MAALIGLFVGAFVGYMLWRDWGAALGGVAGFLIGAKLNASRKSSSARPPSAPAASVPPPRDALVASTDRERALIERIIELERRVGELERARIGAPRTEAFAAAPPIQAHEASAERAGGAAMQPVTAGGSAMEPLTGANVATH